MTKNWVALAIQQGAMCKPTPKTPLDMKPTKSGLQNQPTASIKFNHSMRFSRG